MKVAVVVLGDLGRSPRMLYHCRSLVDQGHVVDLCGFQGGFQLPLDLEHNQRVIVHYLPRPAKMPADYPKIVYLLYAPYKVLLQIIYLFWLLFVRLSGPVDAVLMQNPPAIPTLFVLYIYSWMSGAKLIVDWHNFGYSIMELSMGSRGFKGLVVRFAKWHELSFGRLADAHICVTTAMKRFLIDDCKFENPVSVLYDKPPLNFRRLGKFGEAHAFLLRLSRDIPLLKGSTAEDTIFTSSDGALKPDRPALLISSTSWTEDEDIHMFLQALQTIDLKKSCAAMIVIITGNGPLKEHYLQEIRDMDLKRVTVLTHWLAIEDYPKLLGVADLGICMHFSSSGLDLPMKIVDMYGCGLPVCAIDYSCIGELVEVNETGLVFDTADTLVGCIELLLGGFPSDTKNLDRMRANIIKKYQSDRWSDNWIRVVKPMLVETLKSKHE